MALVMEVVLSPGDFVLDEDPAPYPKRGRAPQFSAHVWPNGCMDQDATWYGGRPRPTRHCVGCGPIYHRKRAHPPHPIFGPCLLWQNSWMDEDAAWYGSRPRPLGPGHTVIDGVPAPAKVAQQPPLFGPCLLWPLPPISATAELLLRYASGQTRRQTDTQTRSSQYFTPLHGAKLTQKKETEQYKM